jgi:flavin-dependent dehydrogenase
MPRLHLDDELRRGLERAGGRLLQGVRVAALERDGARVTGVSGPELRWSAKVVIAADGYGSSGLAALGERQPEGRFLAVSATAYYRNVSFPEGESTADHCFEAELPFGYGWIFPAVDGVANVGVYLRADAYAGLEDRLHALLAGFLERHRDRFAAAEAVGKVRAWSLPLAPRPIPHGAPGLLLAGDAGGFVDPLSGEGIWQALHTGVLAAEIAREAVRGDGVDASLLRRFEARCWRDIGRRSRAKAAVQRGMALIVRRRLYRVPAVRAALRLGYRRRAFEMTKS